MTDIHDIDRLVKCLELTRSDNDDEALAAMRRANAILKRNKLTWAELFEKMGALVTEMAQHQAGYRPDIQKRVNEILNKIHTEDGFGFFR